ncbi:virB8 family protein [Mesorhizobium australicum]|uniref:virB8 family protein n=1 Tax=Mesorhizobium australicum TaxID=536018 RepID=UPI003335924B
MSVVGQFEISFRVLASVLSQNEAVTAANLVRYIRARETYDSRELKQNYDLAQLYSTDVASKDLTWLFTPANPQSLDKIFGRNVTVSVEIKSVSLLNRNTASVRFATTTRRDNSSTADNWVAVIKFRYTSTPLKNEWRFDNPLGFQVTDYRRDQESAPAAGSLQ